MCDNTQQNISHSEAQQIEFISLMTDYKTAIAECKTIKQLDIDYFIAVLGFIASIIALVYGCICNQPYIVFNYIMMALAGLLFAIVLFLQIYHYHPLYWVNRLFAHINNGTLIKVKIPKPDRKKLKDGTLHFLVNNEDDNNNNYHNRETMLNTIVQRSGKDRQDFENLSDEKLVDEYVKVRGTEAGISAYREILKRIDVVKNRINRWENVSRILTTIISFVIVVALIVYIVIIHIH